MSGGGQPQKRFVKPIAPVSFVPGVSVGATAGLSGRASAGPPLPAAFAAANAAGSGTRNGRTFAWMLVGGGSSATSIVATSIAVDGVPTVAGVIPAAPLLADATTITSNVATPRKPTAGARQTCRAQTRVNHLIIVSPPVGGQPSVAARPLRVNRHINRPEP